MVSAFPGRPPASAGTHRTPVIAVRNSAVFSRASPASISLPITLAKAGSGEPRLTPSWSWLAEEVSRCGGLRHVSGSRSACRWRGGRILDRLVLTPIAARSGKGEASWRAKWWTRTNAPSIPISPPVSNARLSRREVSRLRGRVPRGRRARRRGEAMLSSCRHGPGFPRVGRRRGRRTHGHRSRAARRASPAVARGARRRARARVRRRAGGRCAPPGRVRRGRRRVRCLRRRTSIRIVRVDRHRPGVVAVAAGVGRLPGLAAVSLQAAPPPPAS